MAATYSSRDLIARVPLALRSLTAVFGMGTGVTFSLTPPQFVGWTPVKKCYRVILFVFGGILADQAFKVIAEGGCEDRSLTDD